MYPKTQTFFILGISKSGHSAAEFLLKRGANVYLFDDLHSAGVEKNIQSLIQKGAKQVDEEKLSIMHEICDVLVLSPGIPIDHPVAISFKRNKRAVIGETELAARYFKQPLIAVTGTNGKTTTVSMIEKILQSAGEKALSCGNIGVPMIDVVDCDLEVAVAEISSFQMETLTSLHPHIAAILNVTEDHLSRHYNMENYVFLKGKLLKNLTEAEYAVLNYDDGIVRSFSDRTKGKVVYFSMHGKTNGGYLEDGVLYYDGEEIIKAEQLRVDGEHNIANTLAAITVCKLFGVNNEAIVSALTSFKGIRHRIEEVGIVAGVEYIDDSKATNIDATIKAVQSMKGNTTLLLGGKDKGYEYDKLFSFLTSSVAVRAVAYGENRNLLYESAQRIGYQNLFICPDFSTACMVASKITKRGERVLLSPASASFDEFESYEERGDRFVEFVRSLEREEGEGAN